MGSSGGTSVRVSVDAKLFMLAVASLDIRVCSCGGVLLVGRWRARLEPISFITIILAKIISNYYKAML